MSTVWAIVVAGGSGQRFGQMKQFALAGGTSGRRLGGGRLPLLLHRRGPGRSSRVSGVEVAHGADVVVEGGATRAESVRLGLTAVPGAAEVIVVHDAARPLASDALFRAVIEAVLTDGAGGAIPGIPVSDTIKVVDGADNVTRTLDRASLVAVQTPQAFGANFLRRAHAQEGEATDDAALVEALGATVRVVPGDPRNLKITTPADLGTAESLLRG